MSDYSYSWDQDDPDENEAHFLYVKEHADDPEEIAEDEDFHNRCEHTDHDCDDECEECNRCEDCGSDICEHCDECAGVGDDCDHYFDDDEDDDEEESFEADDGPAKIGANLEISEPTAGFAAEEDVRTDEVIQKLLAATLERRKEARNLEQRTQYPNIWRFLDRREEQSKPERNGARWTLDEDKELVDGYYKKELFSDLARTLQRTRTAARARLIWLSFYSDSSNSDFEPSEPLVMRGLPLNDEEHQTVLTCYRNSMPVNEIASILGRPIWEIKEVLLDSYLLTPIDPQLVHRGESQQTKPPFRKWTKAETFNLQQMVQNGIPTEQIAAHLDRSIASIAAKLCSLGEVTSKDLDSILQEHNRK